MKMKHTHAALEEKQRTCAIHRAFESHAIPLWEEGEKHPPDSVLDLLTIRKALRGDMDIG